MDKRKNKPKNWRRLSHGNNKRFLSSNLVVTVHFSQADRGGVFDGSQVLPQARLRSSRHFHLVTQDPIWMQLFTESKILYKKAINQSEHNSICLFDYYQSKRQYRKNDLSKNRIRSNIWLIKTSKRSATRQSQTDGPEFQLWSYSAKSTKDPTTNSAKTSKASIKLNHHNNSAEEAPSNQETKQASLAPPKELLFLTKDVKFSSKRHKNGNRRANFYKDSPWLDGNWRKRTKGFAMEEWLDRWRGVVGVPRRRLF